MPTTKTRLQRKPLRYITSNGKKEAIVLKLDELRRLEKTIEDLEDALAYEKAKREASGFITLEKIHTFGRNKNDSSI